MMSTTTENPGHLARVLSGRDRLALLWLPHDGSRKTPSRADVVPALHRLREHGLAEMTPADPPLAKPADWNATDLGLKVQSEIKCEVEAAGMGAEDAGWLSRQGATFR